MNNTIENQILSDSWFLIGDKAYFSTIFADCVLCADIKNKKINISNDYFDDTTYRLHPYCISHKDKIYLLPDKSNDIVVLHKDNNSIERITIDNPRNKRIKLRNHVIINDVAWLMAGGISSLIRLDMTNDTIRQYILDDEESCEITDISNNGSIIYLIASQNKIYSFDTTTDHIGFVDHDNIQDELNTICFANDFLWLSGKNKALYKLDLQKGKVVIINNFPEEYYVHEPGNDGEEHYVFFKSFLIGNKIWFMQFYGEADICIDLYDNTLSTIKCGNIKYSRYEEASNSPLSYFLYIRDDRFIGKMVDASSEVYEIDSKTLDCILQAFQIDDDLKKYIHGRRVIEESRAYTLDSFIHNINTVGM